MTAALVVLAPVAGDVVAMTEVPDEVFAGELVGPGVAIDPDPALGTTVRAPIDGVIAKLHAHAFVVQAADGRAVLVHLGINTVQLDGEGFTLHAEEGDPVSAGQTLVTWDVAAIAATGRSVVCPVVALDASPEALDRTSTPEGALFTWRS